MGASSGGTEPPVARETKIKLKAEHRARLEDDANGGQTRVH
jgi:hypothetical protein